MIPVSPAIESRHASVWQLCLVFVLALLLFTAMRWQPESWLQHQIDQQARISGIDLRYQTLQVDGLSLRMAHVSIRTAELPEPVTLDSMRISPAWSLLLSGIAAAEVKVTLSGQAAKAVLVRQDKYIDLRDLNAVLDVAALQPLWKLHMPVPVDSGGTLKLSGQVQLDALSGLPVEGQLDVVWQQARIDLPVFKKPLGDYQLTLKATANASGIWQWSLGGGTDVMLSGSGQMNLSGKRPQQWTINGRAQLRAAPEARAIAAMLGTQTKVFAISGKLLNARLQAM